MAVCLMAQGGIQAADRTAEAKAFVQMLQNKQYVEADALCDDTVKQLMSPAQLQEIWEWLAQKYGTFGGVTSSDTWKKEVYDIVYDIVQFPSRFGSTALDIWVVYNPSGQISGLWFLNPTSGGPPASVTQALEPKPAEAQYKAPEYVHNERFQEFEVFVNEGGEWELPGTLTMPKGEGPFPAVVLVHGSGPEDRDETIGPNKPFKDIAWGLASRGVAVLRYDKRTYDKRTKALLVKTADKLTVKEEAIDDALAAVALTHGLQRIDQKRIYVLGHSLGGTLIPRIGKADPKIAGLIVMAGSARPFEDVLLEQIIYIASLKGTLTADDKKELEKVKQQIATIKALKPSSKDSSLLLGAPPSYWLDLRGYVPAEMAKSLKQPMLIMQGSRDYQVTEADFKIWNHVFMTGVGKATPAEYEKPGAVAQSVVSDIGDWIIGQQETAGVK
jgi:dienelactone hydrolase